MRYRVQDVKLPGGILLDGWEVLLGGGIACAVVGGTVKSVHFLVWVGLGLIGLWVITVFLVRMGILPSRPGPTEGKDGGQSQPANTDGTSSGKSRPSH